MKRLTLVLFLLSSIALRAQIKISGYVFDTTNNPLEGASVYLNNTSTGTTTNLTGAYELEVKKGNYILVVSYVGYKTKKYRLNTARFTNPINFNLKEKSNVLNEIVIGKKMPKSKRKALLRKFRKQFLGESAIAKRCKILNEDAIIFDINRTEDTLKVSVSEPLTIVNPALGYTIDYDLVHFKLTPLNISYFGYARYSKIKDLEYLEKEWKENRWKAYHGSKMHFIRGVMGETSEEEGFVVDLIDRVPNPERPSYIEIVAAEKFLRKYGGLQRNPYQSNNDLDAKIDEANYTLQRAELPKYVDEVIESNASGLKYTIVNEERKVFLKTSHYLRVTYTKAPPDKHYDTTNNSKQYQVSVLNLYVNFAEILRVGAFKKPNHVFVQGYWACKKVGDALPFDYNPKDYSR